MTIIQSPATYNFAGNIPDLIVDTTEQLSFTLSRGGTQIVAETYTPAQNDRIVINLRNLLELLVEVPGYEEVATPIAQYTYTLGSTTGTFYCLPGGHGAAVSAESFLRGNFLTWQPQTRVTLYHTPHRLRYAALAACVCKVKGYFTDGTSAVISLLTMSAGNIYTMDVSFGTIRGKFDTQPTYYDVWVENTMGQAMTWGQRYMLADFEAGTNDYFIFANSLGGFDTIRFSGDRKEINKLESVNAIFDDQTLEYDIDRTRSWKKYTGYIADERLRMWVLDFFNSPQRYHLTDSGALQRIYVSEPKLEDTAGETAGYEFTYAYSRQSRYINLERAETPQLLEITDPASEVFFLAPRLNQFEAADPASSADYLIPIQAAAADKWLAISLASLLDYIKPTGIDVDALQDYLTDHKYATQAWVFQQNFLTTAALDNYLLKSVWDEVFEVTTVNGVRVLNVKLDIVGLKGISAYGLGSTSGSGASGSLGELVNVGQWADEVPTADRVMVQLAGATHWSAKPLADLVGLDTAALAQYLTANSYLKASDISSYLTWANLSGKPTVYPTSWELVTGRPTKLSDLTDDVVAGNYLPKPTWDAVFEVVTVDGTPALKVKYDILGLKGITAYADGTLSGGFSGALVDLVDVAVTNLASGDILKYNGTHFVNVPVSSIAGASSWDQITGKPEYYPTRWADVSGAPTSLPASDVYPWAKAASKPTYTAAEVGALALSGGTLTGNVITIGSFILANSGAYPQLTFRATADNSERLLFRHGNDLKWRYNGTNDGIIYHSGNFNPSSKLDKSVWDEAFEIKTVDGVRVISAKLDFLSVAGISAYATGPSSGGGGGGLDYDLLKQALTGAITPDGYPFTISTSFLGAIDKTYLTGKLANTYADKVHTHLWADITDRPTSLPPGGNAGGDLAGTYPNPTIGAGKVTTAKIADGAVTAAKLADQYVANRGAVSDLNKAVTYGFYTYDATTQNAPTSYGSVIVVEGTGRAGNWIQLALGYSAGNVNPSVFVRFRQNLKSWSDWVKVWKSNDLDPSSFAQIKSYTYPSGGINNITDLDFTGNILAHFPGDEYSSIWQGKDFVGTILQLKLRDYAGKQSMMYRGSLTKTWRTVWDSGNFNPDNYLLNTANAVSASKWATARILTLTGSASGNVSMDGSANVSLSVTNNRLNSNSEMTYGWNGINYFNLPGTAGAAAKVNDTPTTAWWHILRFNHGNSAGYYTDLAVPFNNNTLHYKRVASGTLQNGGWVKIWDEKNSNLSTVDWAAKNITAAGTVTAPTFSGNLSGSADKLFARYTLNGGQQGPGYFGKERFGCLMMNTPVNGDSHYKNWLICDAYSGSDVGGATAIGVDRQDMRVFAMSSDANRTSWNRSCELYTTVNANLSTVNWTANTLTATKLVIGGITIDVYNGALRVNGNLVATGGVTSLATA